MTQHQWDLIGYGVWAIIIWMTLKQFLQTRREVKGNGFKLLLGDWLLFAPVPWIAYCMGSRATMEQVGWTVLIGVALAVPYILTTRFERKPDGAIRFVRNPLFYAFLFSFPVIRYYVRDYWFHKHPILFPNHRPDIELMLAQYIAALVIYTFVWRLFMYVSYKRAANKAAVGSKSAQA